MNWDDIQLLLAVARAGGPSAASKRLGASRTTIARRLTALERALGAKLFDRTPAGLRPTRVVLELARDAESMEAAAIAIERRLAGEDTRLAGEVRLTATEALGSQFIAPYLARFREEQPEIAVELVSEMRALSLARREADIAVRLLRPEESTSVGQRLGEIAYAAYAHPRVSVVDGAPLLGYAAPVAGLETEWLAERFPRSAFVLRSNSTLALAAAARAGMGIALLPMFIGDADASLRRVAGPRGAPPSELWLVTHRDSRSSARVTALRRFLVALFRRHAPRLSPRLNVKREA